MKQRNLMTSHPQRSRRSETKREANSIYYDSSTLKAIRHLTRERDVEEAVTRLGHSPCLFSSAWYVIGGARRGDASLNKTCRKRRANLR